MQTGIRQHKPLKLRPESAVLLGIAAGFAFLIGLGAGVGALTAEHVPFLAGFGALIAASLPVAFSRR